MQEVNRAHSKVVAVLSTYVSRLNAEGALGAALRRRGISSSDMRLEHVPQLVPDLQRAIKLFGSVDPTRLRNELLSIASQGSRATLPPVATVPAVRRVEIRSEDDIVVARRETRELCEFLGAGSFATQRVATVVAELARNIVAYTPGGTIELESKAKDKRLVCIRARDRGRGISNLQEIMSGRYRSATGLGLGLLGTKRLSESFNVKTGPTGTEIDVQVRT